jgi:phosphoglycerol transferase MdoB-like AlkP superfamily enzyme
VQKSFLHRITYSRWNVIYALLSVLLALSFLTRLLLLVVSWRSADLSLLQLPGIFIIGLFYDIVNAGYFIIPLTIYLWLLPGRIYRSRINKGIIYFLFSVCILILLFNAVSEWFFWDEFTTRYNFIAVDYLVYTTEVLGNIQQSYPMPTIITVLLIATIFVVYFSRKKLNAALQSKQDFKSRTTTALLLLCFPVLCFFTVNTGFHSFSSNRVANDLAGNSIYELFAAFRNNELDYEQFYAVNNEDDSFKLVRKLLAENDTKFISDDVKDLTHEVVSQHAEKHLNVVLISVESLSAEYLGKFGNTEHITPFLDSLADRSLFFRNMYATGTRTVRGLEALSLCIPPTPGQSIVRRPANENLYTLGKVFNEKGYDSKFIYGGYGYFDNMSYFFSNNGYEVVDRTAINDKDIAYENIWGVADENLFTLAEKEIQKTVDGNRNVFAHIMTTSNHRPFTYPEGRIDIPSHQSREGAVKYTDYAIGKFIKECHSKNWFNNTVFIIVADHCASSAGKTELPVNKYHIPLFIYSPANILPAKCDKLMSQIDIGPTLLGLLNFNYTSHFFGFDIFKTAKADEHAFISTYQDLGYIKGNKLVILSPVRKQEMKTIDTATNDQSASAVDPAMVKEAIAWYQVSSDAFKEHLLTRKK